MTIFEYLLLCENKYFSAQEFEFLIGYFEIRMLDGGITGLISFTLLQLSHYLFSIVKINAFEADSVVEPDKLEQTTY